MHWKGATGKFLEFLVKKFKSHRSLPAGWETYLDGFFNEFVTVKTEKDDITQESIDDFLGKRDTQCRRHLLAKLKDGSDNSVVAETDEESDAVLEESSDEEEQQEKQDAINALHEMEAWLLQPNVVGSNLEEGTGRKGQNSYSEESSLGEEESCDDEDEINMRYYGKWPTDLSVN